VTAKTTGFYQAAAGLVAIAKTMRYVVLALIVMNWT